VIVRPIRRILPAGLALVLATTAFAAWGSVPAGYQTQASTPLAAGVDHEALTLADPPQSVHVARVAPGASARLAAVSAGDAIAHGGGGEFPSDMCRRVGCYAGITADFRDSATGEPAGGVVAGGVMLRSPIPGRPQLLVTGEGHLSAGPLDWTGTVTASDGRTVAVGGVNVEPRPGDVVLYTPAWGAPVPDGFDTELILRAGGPVGVIGATTAVDIAGLQSDPVAVPADGAVLAASGSASTRLHELFDLADGGRISRTLRLRIDTAVPGLTESLGGEPAVLAGGHPAYPDTGDSLTAERHPRSLVGWNAAGEVVLVTVDGGRPDAAGMTMAEAADLLSGLGATDGFGFDNSSATFVAAGQVQNLPTDDPAPGAPAPADGREVAPGHMERPAVNALMVMPPAPPAPGSGGSGSGSGSGSGAGNGSGPGSGGGPGAGGGSGTGPTGGPATGTTAPLKLTTAGGGPAPAVGGLVSAPPAGSGHSGAPTVDDILRNPTTKQPRRITKGGDAKGKKTRDGGDQTAADPSIPDWADINAALTPDALAAPSNRPAELALAPGGPGHHHPGRDLPRLALDATAAGMILAVLSGLRRVRLDRRPRPALWL